MRTEWDATEYNLNQVRSILTAFANSFCENVTESDIYQFTDDIEFCPFCGEFAEYCGKIDYGNGRIAKADVCKEHRYKLIV